MVFAVNLPIASYQVRKLESLRMSTNIVAKAIIFSAFTAALVLWTAGPLQMPRSAYSVSHPYFGVVPVLAYVYLRNSCKFLREHHIAMFSALGKYSLEIFLLHHHAFANGRCVRLVPGYPRCNFALVSVLLLCAAQALQRLSVLLRHMLLPENDESTSKKRAVSIVVGIATLYALTRLLVYADMVSVGSISTIMVVCGILLFQRVVDRTWAGYRDFRSNLNQHTVRLRVDKSSTAEMSPPLISILVFAAALYALTFLNNAYKPCIATVNAGHWVPVSPCSRRKLREFHAVNYVGPKECSDSNSTYLEWSWPNQHCGYRYRGNTEVRQKLQGKKVVLIGDASVRSLFLSLSRFMGDASVAGFETLHSDARKIYGSSIFEYKWAPLSVDIVTKLKSLKNAEVLVSGVRRPDLIIAGGK